MSPECSSESGSTVADGAALKGRSGLMRLWLAGGYSLAGLRAAYRGEAAFRQVVLLCLLLIPLAFLLEVSRVERAVLIAVVLLEATVDRISLELHPLSKRAKDMGSAAQLLTMLLIALIWAVILL